jgi:hypothetical protein
MRLKSGKAADSFWLRKRDCGSIGHCSSVSHVADSNDVTLKTAKQIVLARSAKLSSCCITSRIGEVPEFESAVKVRDR